jgi:hypothetical protein
MDARALAEYRSRLRAGGYSPIPLNGKRPVFDNWQHKTETSEEEISTWSDQYASAKGTGIVTKFTPALDIDILDDKAAAAVEFLARKRFGDRGRFLVRFGLAPKCAIPFQARVPFKKIVKTLTARNGKGESKIEFLGDGQQIAVAGIHPDTGKPYRWVGGSPAEVARADLPDITEGEAEQFVADAVELLIHKYGYKAAQSRPKQNANGSSEGGGSADWSYLTENIRAGRELHDSLRDYAAKLVTSGMNGGAAVNLLRSSMDAMPAEDKNERWRARYADIPRLVEDAEGKFGGGSQDAAPIISATPFVAREPATMRRRQWLYSDHLIRGFCSATYAPPKKGKSTQIIVELIAQATNRSLLGIQPRRRCRVWYVGEDPREEIERHILATCIHYKIDSKELEGWFFYDSSRDLKIILAQQAHNGTQFFEPVADALIAELKAKHIDVLAIDPFISSHKVAENDNMAIDAVVKKWNDIAEATNIAIELSHHTRKTYGQEVTVEDGRGASSHFGAVRHARTLNPMSEKEAADADITNRHLYFRVEGTGNMSPPAEKADWHQFISVALGNDDPDIGEPGDNVGVVVRWQYPDLMAGMTAADFDKVAAVVKAGEWRADQRADRWVGYAVAKGLDLNPNKRRDKAKIRAALKTWLAAGSLEEVEGQDEKRNRRTFVVVKATSDA